MKAYVDKLARLAARTASTGRMPWLDLARYADSAGYADDPPRTIWPFRDYVIRSLNANKPLDQFTIEQIAGDLLPNPTEEQLIATAFHRNTLTNNEGGTNDEEFRNVAVVDRVNTTLAVWMGTTMACAQCHTPQVRPDHAGGIFPLLRVLQQHRRRRQEGRKPDPVAVHRRAGAAKGGLASGDQEAGGEAGRRHAGAAGRPEAMGRGVSERGSGVLAHAGQRSWRFCSTPAASARRRSRTN